MKSSVTDNGRDVVKGRPSAPLWLLAGFWISLVISVAVVVRRLVAIIHPSQSATSPTDSLDATFASHAALTLAHIVPAMALVLLTAFVFLRRAEAAWAERLLFPLGSRGRHHRLCHEHLCDWGMGRTVCSASLQ